MKLAPHTTYVNFVATWPWPVDRLRPSTRRARHGRYGHAQSLHSDAVGRS